MTTERRKDSALRAVALVNALLSTAVLVGAALRSDGWTLSWVGFSLVGLVIVRSVPGNVTGWLMLAVGFGMATSQISTATGTAGSYPSLEWFGIFSLLVPLLVGLLLVTFPGGRIPSPRWRPVVALGWAGTLGLLVVFALAKPELVIDVDVAVANPMHLPALRGLAVLEPLLTGLVAAFIALVVINLVVRFRRARGLERQQFRWLAFAAAVAPIVLAVAANSPSDLVTVLGFVLALNLIPSAIGVAVQRYRLYDIDRLISRTLSYTVVVVLLAGVYLAAVTFLGSLVPADDSFAIAGSTLAAAALFNPVRSWARDHVDRFFDRTRYERQQVVDEFTASIRDETELARLTDGVGSLVSTTLRPREVGIWIADQS